MPDRHFYTYTGSQSLGDLFSGFDDIVPLTSSQSEIMIHHALPIEKAGINDLCFYNTQFYKTGINKELLENCQAKACLINEEHAPLLKAYEIIPVITSFPRIAFNFALNKLYQEIDHSSDSSLISDQAKIGKNVKMGAGCIIGAGAEIGEGSIIESGAMIGSGCVIGKQSVIASGSVIRFSIIGDRFSIGPNSVIGHSGFAIELSNTGPVELSHKGCVLIGHDVSVGAGSMIDRGLIQDTVIGNKVKIDNLCQIAHNVSIGDFSVLAGMVGIAGSSKIGKGVLMGARVGISDHIQIGDFVKIAAASLVMNHIPSGEIWGGIPSKPHREWLRDQVKLRKLLR